MTSSVTSKKSIWDMARQDQMVAAIKRLGKMRISSRLCLLSKAWPVMETNAV